MLLNGKPIDDITESDLQALIDNKVLERKTIDYKEILPDNSDRAKSRFLFNVSSFANASGGHLIFGMKEDKGVPIEIIGLEINDIDGEKLRLENMIRDGIAPRIPVYTIHPVLLENGKYVIIIDIPRSFALPHMVTFQNSSRFYSRNSAGKYQLDVNEIRTAFTVSQTLLDRIRDFRRECLSMIFSGETPYYSEDINPLNKYQSLPFYVLHIVPLNAFDINSQYHLKSVELYFKEYYKVAGRYNFDGYYVPLEGHIQFFRNGIIEIVSSYLIEAKSKDINMPEIEQYIIKSLKISLELLQKIGVTSYLFIMLSFIKVKNYYITEYNNLRYRLDRQNNPTNYPIDRDNLILPEIMIEDYNVDLPTVMKPIFDAVWNAAGYPQSMNYDQQGNWKGNQR